MQAMLPQKLDDAVCYEMLRARDARFDGRFFVGVSSTRIYCRPVCSARTPRRENCSFFGTAAAAEHRGYRPCLRCRPELAPGYASLDASAGLVQAAASMIEEGALDHADVASLAARIGVSDRHLRRLFEVHFGVSPNEYARTQRLLLAKRLLTDTRLPVTDVALASGFASVRRFNDCFARSYRMSPTALRREREAGGPGEGAAAAAGAESVLAFRLAFRPPYDWDSMTAFLAARTIDGVESVEALARGHRRVYRRVVRARGGRLGWIEVAGPGRARDAGVLTVRIDPALVGVIPSVLGGVRRAFDLSCRPDEVAQALGDLARARPGLRLPGTFDGYELAVRAVLGQQITVKAARTLAARFVGAFGAAAASPWPTLSHAFPSAAQIAGQDPAAIASLGIVGQRARTIVALAQAFADGALDCAPGVDPLAFVERLQQVPGVGPWTAQYVAMRVLGWPDAFPAADVGLMRALGVDTARRAEAAAERWRPWRSYAVIHLWMGLAEPGEKPQ